MKNSYIHITILIGIVLCTIGCSPQTIVPPPFDGNLAYTYLEQQVAFGPRVPGTEASAKCREYFKSFFDSLNIPVDSQVFIFPDPYSGKNITMVNFIAHINNPKSSVGRIVLLAHYDSRPRAEYASDSTLKDKPIDGANDGASGVAVLMELARLSTKQLPPCDIDLVFVDGEDWGKPGDNQYYLLGSKEFARRVVHGTYRFGIVLDMVGDKQQQFYREGYSEKFQKPLNDMIWNTARELGISTFIDSVKHAILDDHLSLLAVGIPAVDIIDIDYPYWHTEFDTPDKCSAEALSNVGRVVTEIIYNPSKWPSL